VSAVVKSADVTTVLNRIGLETAADNLVTGDRVLITTTDSRGLLFIAPSSWLDGDGTYQTSFSAFVNVNAAGGLRLFPTFTAAVNNTRSSEYSVQTFEGNPLLITLTINDVTANVLGDVTSYTFNTNREGLDITTLNDKFKRMYSAGLISGSGSIDCLFNSVTSGVKETPLLMLQLINRVDIGSEFDLLLSITDSDNDSSAANVFYEFTAMVTRSGLEVTATDIISCSIDFVTTGEIRLLIGRPSGYVLKEDDDRLALNQNSLEFLLVEEED
jgi:hypothetical protein